MRPTPEENLGDELDGLTTEHVDEAMRDLDLLSTEELVRAMHQRDRSAVDAVDRVLPAIVRAVDSIAERMERGGRLVYVGAGTSGRLGVLDASECPPTFGTDPATVVGVIAGGDTALRCAAERAEDEPDQGGADVAALSIGPDDSVVGISASGRTPYVLGALHEARQRSALTIAVACNSPSRSAAAADIAIEPVVGSEIIAGSTRLGAATAQKLVLNMLSTLTMIRLGKTFGNVMIDLRATNEKLVARSLRTISAVTGADAMTANAALDAAEGSVKVAVFALLSGSEAAQARRALKANGGRLRAALASAGITVHP
ncbi:N-acetylmuramic acid 6-phosphate etherase [Curtobacterium sp. A7_M15]|uniref:N-acetylmuramic acid 6-phosphate etherase n=1 Tax=Curtobacterium sp. A7_M15 TaxID=3065241 RepID=UPI002737FD49|nr:N-acetylmuramic acid 6-phosphate etherase [Curtobacterium sp. A7_M15]MDP4331963.1 N-acetylmuramic acid 6-phosphate etherase [Curtobacterium sp. A7_M15]